MHRQICVKWSDRLADNHGVRTKPRSKSARAKQPPQTQNRRRCQRVSVITHVETLANGCHSVGYSRDISKKGLSVETYATFSKHSEVRIRFYLPPYPPGNLIDIIG